jgi:hypothetical protein
MALADIPDIRVESVGDEVTYSLPTRPLGRLRFLGLFPIGVSAAWFGIIGNTFLPQLRQLIDHSPTFSYFFGAFILGVMMAGLAPAGFGLLILFGRCRILWRDGHLTISERVGPFGWPRRMPRRPIVKFIVMGGTAAPGDRTLPGPFATLGLLLAKFESGAPRTIVTGYPRPWLEAIAHDLSARAGLAQSTEPPVEVYRGLTEELKAKVVEKPANSPVVLQRSDANVAVLDVPPIGLWKGSGGIFTFAIPWCLVIGAVTVAFVCDKKFDPKAIPFFAIFWLVGLGMLAVGVNLGKRRAKITAGPSALTVVKSGPFGTKRLDFRRADIANVCAGVSSMEQNHHPVPELQVHLVSGKKVGFLLGRDPEELRWIATELRNSLGLETPVQSTEPEFMGRPFPGAGPWQAGTPFTKFIGLLVFAVVAVAIFWHPLAGFLESAHAARPTKIPSTNSLILNKPISGDLTLVFNSFGPNETCKLTNNWAVGREAHGEWFIPTMSGNLSEIVMAVEPVDGNPRPGKANIFITGDKNGFPGRTLESFSTTVGGANGILVFESARQPALRAGVKYWLCASSRGAWSWHLNNQEIIHNTAREVSRGKWASAGDFCYVGAFSIRVSTNQPPVQLEPPAGDDRDGSNNVEGPTNATPNNEN